MWCVCVCICVYPVFMRVCISLSVYPVFMCVRVRTSFCVYRVFMCVCTQNIDGGVSACAQRPEVNLGFCSSLVPSLAF